MKQKSIIGPMLRMTVVLKKGRGRGFLSRS